MKKFMSFSKKKKVIVVVVVLFVVMVAIFLFRKGNDNIEILTVNKVNFSNQVSVSGKVVPAENVDLGFKSGGLIDRVYFSIGQTVKKGQIIASLDSTDVKGALEVAKANYQKVLNGATSTDINVAKAEVETAQVALNQTKIQQEVLVKNAKKNLLNSGFVVTTEDQLSSETPPVISGTYLKEEEGQIALELYSSSGGTSFKTTGLVNVNGMVNTEIPQPIGDTGLYIKFSSTINNQTKWKINIPNKQSSQYLANFNAYQSALSTQIQAIANAEALLAQAKSVLALKQASARPEDVSAASGALLIAQGNYNDKFIFAPFDGQITKMDARVGEIASPNVPLISMMSDGIFQIESFVPEVNISQIKIGDEARITLDAYGDNTIFKSQVVSMDPTETIRGGVSTYRIKLQFEDKDDRIKSGMTANVSVVVFEKPGTITIPEGVMYEKSGKTFVEVKKDNKIEEREISIGAKSSLGQVEVLSGLSAGEEVVLKKTIQ